MNLPDLQFLQEVGAPLIAAAIEAQGQPLELRRKRGQGGWTNDGQQVSSGGVEWTGKGIVVPLTHQQAVDAGSSTPTPVLQVFLPPSAPAGKPDLTLVDVATGLTYHPRRDAIDWKGLVWDLLVDAPGERSQ